METNSKSLCHDCGVSPKDLHKDGCDVERCAYCGFQAISCGCDESDYASLERLVWTGEWPGDSECREFGWYSKLIPDVGWICCQKDDEGASEDLNRLCIDAKWDRELRRFVRTDI